MATNDPNVAPGGSANANIGQPLNPGMLSMTEGVPMSSLPTGVPVPSQMPLEKCMVTSSDVPFMPLSLPNEPRG